MRLPFPFRPAAAALAALPLATCAEPTGGESPRERVEEVRLTTRLAFAPAELVIPAGTTVRWVNDAAVYHTITPADPAQPGVWRRQASATQGEVFRHTFTVPGQTYRYLCEPHASASGTGMVGVIRVR